MIKTEIVENKEIVTDEDRYSMLLSDYNSLKRRTNEKIKSSERNGSNNAVMNLMDIYDDILRFKSDSGCSVISRKFKSILKSMGYDTIDSEYMKGNGYAFDDSCMECIGIEGDAKGSYFVKSIYSIGLIDSTDGTVIRYAKVIVKSK